MPLLGDLNNKVIENDRGEVVETVQVYYIDYLQRCQDYGYVRSFLFDLTL